MGHTLYWENCRTSSLVWKFISRIFPYHGKHFQTMRLEKHYRNWIFNFFCNIPKYISRLWKRCHFSSDILVPAEVLVYPSSRLLVINQLEDLTLTFIKLSWSSGKCKLYTVCTGHLSNLNALFCFSEHKNSQLIDQVSSTKKNTYV